MSTLSQRGFTMVEAVAAAGIVSLLTVAALTAAGSAARLRAASEDRVTAALLAQDLLTEIQARAYDDPDAIALIGAEEGSTRAIYDDVDDYDTMLDSPPRLADGTPMSGKSAWSRSVRVEYVSPTSPDVPVGTDQGAKRITVTALKHGSKVLSLSAVRTRAFDDAH
jgi:type II secretory pathway pseudopilin PulG